MERGEQRAGKTYRRIAAAVPGVDAVARDEEQHENELIALLDEERLKYVGAVVRGLNDALVELTGALAGLTFAFGRPRIIAVAGLITGISASLSMAGSEYLATRAQPGDLRPGKAAFYTGLAYVFTVSALVAPYLIFDNLALCLGLLIGAALAIVALFTFYISVAREGSFGRRFLEMAGISIGIAALCFGVGVLVRTALPFEM